MSLNEDILHLVTKYADAPTLVVICLLSHATRWPATRLLYRSVHVRSLDTLGTLEAALAQNERLGPLVLEFFQDCSRDMPAAWTRVELGTQRFPDRFDNPLCRIVYRLVNLHAVALEDVSYAQVDTKEQLSVMLAALQHLHSVCLPGIGSANLMRIGTHAGLEYVSDKEGVPVLITDWLLGHADTLKSLRIASSGLLYKLLILASQNIVFPKMHTLSLPGEGFSMVAVGRRVFPGLRSLTILRPQRDLSRMWPHLQHLSFTITEGDTLIPLPPVSSLRLNYTGTDPGKLTQLHEWSAHHVQALVLSCPECGFSAHAEALRIYTRLRMFEIHLPSGENDVVQWMWRARRLSARAVPAGLEVLTLRNAARIDVLSEETVNGVRVRAPSLKLVRVISTHGRQRRVYGWPAPLDWRGACEMVADYLPHWRETRAPWDNICDL